MLDKTGLSLLFIDFLFFYFPFSFAELYSSIADLSYFPAEGPERVAMSCRNTFHVFAASFPTSMISDDGPISFPVVIVEKFSSLVTIHRRKIFNFSIFIRFPFLLSLS